MFLAQISVTARNAFAIGMGLGSTLGLKVQQLLSFLCCSAYMGWAVCVASLRGQVFAAFISARLFLSTRTKLFFD
jgi:hypothetical protein